MTATQQQGSTAQLDMGRVLQRNAQLNADLLAGLTAELGMAREVQDLQQQRIAELERVLEEKDAELARAHQANAALQQPATESESTQPATESEAPKTT